jgi:beta-1,2-mannobiose phosphorylase / 1,2-beta-oligomannan phosphorylase
MTDLAHRHDHNPLLSPADIKPSIEGMEAACLLNPGAFSFAGESWLLPRVAERPVQRAGKTSFPILDTHQNIKVLEFDHADPRLDLSDPRVIRYTKLGTGPFKSHIEIVEVVGR